MFPKFLHRKTGRKRNRNLEYERFDFQKFVVIALLVLLYLLVVGGFYLIKTGKIMTSSTVNGFLVGGAIEFIIKLIRSAFKTFSR
jgi:hypothetical protein